MSTQVFNNDGPGYIDYAGDGTYNVIDGRGTVTTSGSGTFNVANGKGSFTVVSSSQQTDTFTSDNTWSIPPTLDATHTILVECWGKGGTGGAGEDYDTESIPGFGAGGGGGGSYSSQVLTTGEVATIKFNNNQFVMDFSGGFAGASVNDFMGSPQTICVARDGGNGNDGQFGGNGGNGAVIDTDTNFSGSVTAHAGGNGGSGAAGNGVDTGGNAGGGGGAGGPSNAGGDGEDASGGGGGNGGTSDAGSGNGGGGASGQELDSGRTGSNGFSPGGGSGGGSGSSLTGTSGGVGGTSGTAQIKITYWA